MVVRQPQLLGVEASRLFEVPQSRSLRKGFDVYEHFGTEALALVDDGLVRDTRELAECDNNCKGVTASQLMLVVCRWLDPVGLHNSWNLVTWRCRESRELGCAESPRVVK